MTDRIVAELDLSDPPKGRARRHVPVHAQPDQAHGWLLCLVGLADNFHLVAELWWNEDSIGSGWWVGVPGRCLGLEELWSGAVVRKVLGSR